MMKLEKIEENAYCSLSDVGDIIEFVLELVHLDEGFEDFSLSNEAAFQLRSFITSHAKHPLSVNSGQLTTAQFSENVLDAFRYLRGMSSYKECKHNIELKKLPKLLEENKKNKSAIQFLKPEDCQALKDWPERRLPANGHSGRLENAGQFIQRIFDQGLYSEEKFGRLYLADLRRINPKLYQALVQWQKRTGQPLKMLGTKGEAVEARLEAYERGELVDYEEVARVHSTKARQKRKALNLSP